MDDIVLGGKRTPEGEKLNLSKTQFITYISCSKKYYFKYIRGWTEPSDKENFKKGNAIHDFWENMYTEYCSVEDGKIVLDEHLEGYKRKYYDLIENIMDFEQRRYDRIVKEKGLDPEKYFFPISVEEKFEVDGLRGLPDAIYRREDGTLEVFDLKSTFYSGWKHKFEILFYAKLVQESDRFDEPVTGGALYAAKTDKVDYYNFDTWDIMELEARLRDARKGIKDGNFRPCDMNWCTWDNGPPEEAYLDKSRVRK